MLRPLAALLAVAAVAVTSGLGASPAQAATPAASVVVAPRGGGIVEQGRDLDVDVTVANTGDARLPPGRLAFSLESQPVASTTALAAEIARPVEVLLGNLATRTTATTPALDPGETRTVTARLSSADLTDLLSAASGARLLYVRFRAQGLQRVAESAVVKMAKGTRDRIGFATVIPIVASANSTGLVDAAAQASLTAPDGAWSTALDAARQDASATIALDPEVIASIRLAGAAAPLDATRFLDGLRALPNEFVRLAYADGDVALQRAAGIDAPLEPSSFVGSSIAAAADATGTAPTAAAPSVTVVQSAADLTDWAWSDRAVTWPVPGTASAADVAAGGKDGGSVLLPSTDVVDTAARVAAGPAARIGAARALIADARASRLLAISAQPGTSGQAALAELTGLLATAAVTGETTAVLAVPGRTADTAGVGRTLGLLARQPWVTGRSLTQVAATTSLPAIRLARTGIPAARLSTANGLVAGERTVQQLGAAIDRPAALIGPERLALLGALSAAWRSDDRSWTAQAAAITRRFAMFAGRVHLADQPDAAKGGGINAIGNDGHLKVPVSNDLGRPVTVLVHASASNGKIQFSGSRSARVTVPANASRSAVLPYRTIANGPTEVMLSLTTPKGVSIGPTVGRKATVRAGFDTIVAAGLLTALAALLALGVYRNVQRRRRPKPVNR